MPARTRTRTPSPRPPSVSSPPAAAPASYTQAEDPPMPRPPLPKSTLSNSSAARTEDWARTYTAYHLAHPPPTRTPSPPASDISSMPSTPKSDTYRFVAPLTNENGEKKTRPQLSRQDIASEGRPMMSAKQPWSRRQSEEDSPYTMLPEVVPGFQVSFPPPAAVAAANTSRPTSSSSASSSKPPYHSLAQQDDIPEPLRVGPRPTIAAAGAAPVVAAPSGASSSSPVSPPGSSLGRDQARRPAFYLVSGIGSKKRTYSPGGSEIDPKRD
jgi:hypothetical protein